MAPEERRLVFAPDAFIRTYVGDDGWYWVVVRRDGRRVRLDLADRVLIDVADGERTAEEQSWAAEHILARPMSPREATDRLARLVDHGALLDSATGFSEPLPSWPLHLVPRRLDEAEAAALTAAPLAGARLSCDGRGSCCRLPDRVTITEEDVARLRTAWPDGSLTPGGLSLDSAIAGDTNAGLFLAARDGSCMLLEEDGRCGAHVALGAAGKPAACRTAPLIDLLIGNQLLVGPALECRCALDFAQTGETFDESANDLVARRRAGGTVLALSPTIAATTTVRLPQTEYLAWSAAARARAAEAPDLIVWALAEAAALSGSPAPAWPFAPILAAVAETLRNQLGSDADETARAYSHSDLQVAAYGWAFTAADRLVKLLERAEPALPPVDGERLLVDRALALHGLARARTLAAGLIALALRLALARTGAPDPLPPALHPLTTVEYLFSHGLGELTDRFAAPIDEYLGKGR